MARKNQEKIPFLENNMDSLIQDTEFWSMLLNKLTNLKIMNDDMAQPISDPFSGHSKPIPTTVGVPSSLTSTSGAPNLDIPTPERGAVVRVTPPLVISIFISSTVTVAWKNLRENFWYAVACSVFPFNRSLNSFKPSCVLWTFSRTAARGRTLSNGANKSFPFSTSRTTMGLGL